MTVVPSDKPLAGKRIVVTRAQDQASGFVQELEAMGAEVLRIPTIQIVPPQSYQPLDRALKKIPGYDWLILTSVNGVRALELRMRALDVDVALLRHLKVCAIGPATRDASQRLGLKVTVTPTEYVAESVVKELRGLVSGTNVLLVRAKVARDLLPRELREAGAEVEVVEAYETIAPKNARQRLRAALIEAAQKPDAITFTSSSTVKHFVASLTQGTSPKQVLKDVAVASIGPVTSTTLRENGISVTVEAKEFTTHGLALALFQYFQEKV